MSRHVLVLISEDDLDLVPATGDHRSQMVRGDVDGPLLLVEEDGAHPGGDPPHEADLSAQHRVLVTLLDQDLDIWAVPVLRSEDVRVPTSGWMVRRL